MGLAAYLEEGDGVASGEFASILEELKGLEGAENTYISDGEHNEERRNQLIAVLEKLVKEVDNLTSSEGLESQEPSVVKLKLVKPRLAYDLNRLRLGMSIASKFSGLKAVGQKVEGGAVSDVTKVEYGPSGTGGFYKSEATDRLVLTAAAKKARKEGNTGPETEKREVPGKTNAVALTDPPNYGARAIAMYELDRLLTELMEGKDKTPLLVDTEFASLNSGIGIMMAKAGGVSGAGFTVPVGDLPVLTRCLARLQLLDAIAGQLDRHLGNYYVASDASGPVLVIGIDNDLAFGRKARLYLTVLGVIEAFRP